jgi:hydroxymethylglutaryl-CoA lyase
VIDRVRIYEVGPRDGLQNEATPLAPDVKRRFVELLVDAGLREVEATSFVAPSAIPALADANELLPTLPRGPGVRYPVLVPNMRGMARAEAAAADAVAVFTATTDAFTTHNIRMTVEESLAAFAPVLARAGELGCAATSRPRSGARTPAPSRRDVPSKSRSGSWSGASRRCASATRSASACRPRSTS